MKAYVLVDISIVDRDGFFEYAERIPDLIRRNEGKYLIRGEAPDVVLAGQGQPDYVALLEFPSKELANAFLEARNESGLADLFARSTNGRILLAVGVNEDESAST